MQNTSLWSSPWIPFRLYCRSATAVTNDLILTELDNGQQSLFCNPSLLVIILTETWDAFLDHIVPQWKERSSWGYKKDFVDETLYVLSPAWWLQGWNFNTTFLTHRGTKRSYQFISVQFSGSVVFDFLRPHGLQHTRPPCPLPTPGVYSNSSPLNQSGHLRSYRLNQLPVANDLINHAYLTKNVKMYCFVFLFDYNRNVFYSRRKSKYLKFNSWCN